MRTLSLVDCVELKYNGTILTNGICFGDCDNDTKSEFIFGNTDGELWVYRGNKCICSANELGTISVVAVGDLLNIKKNVLVVITIEGWCHVFDVESEVGAISRTPQGETSETSSEPIVIWPFHSQRIPPNTKFMCLGDVNGDGFIEMIIALTDRVVRTYQWRVDDDDKQLSGNKKEDPRSEEMEIYEGRLFPLNKWELANQVGSLSLHRSQEFTSILVGQPGGTVERITEMPLSLLVSGDNSVSTINSTTGRVISSSASTIVPNTNTMNQHCRHREQSISSPVENITIDYFTLGHEHMMNLDLPTEVVGNVLSDDGMDNDLYAVATSEGTIIVAKDNLIQWTFEVERQILSLCQIDGKLLACTWNGETFLIDGKTPTRLHFEENVSTFTPGLFAIGGDYDSAGIVETCNLICMAYVTFNEKIYIYPIPELN